MTYQEMNRRLRTAIGDDREAQAAGRQIAAHAFGLSWADALCGALEALTPGDKERLERIVSDIEAGRPVQYAVGLAPFCGRLFEVSPAVLIPRPETEELAGLIAQQDFTAPPTILDIGTGSGCIAVTLALEIAGARVDAIDISEEALAVARRNAAKLGANVRFHHVDIIRCAERDKRTEAFEGCSLIVSNPPYIAEKERAQMEPHVVEHEPHVALFVPDDDPLLFYRAIADKALHWLKPDGQLWFEINPLYADDLCRMMQAMGYGHTDLLRDSFGKQRFLRITH